VGFYLLIYRRMRGMSRQDLAAHLGVTLEALSALERRERPQGEQATAHLATEAGCDFSALAEALAVTIWWRPRPSPRRRRC
jgi:transcriptional regulator with XRE-family HTH domain